MPSSSNVKNNVKTKSKKKKPIECSNEGTDSLLTADTLEGLDEVIVKNVVESETVFKDEQTQKKWINKLTMESVKIDMDNPIKIVEDYETPLHSIGGVDIRKWKVNMLRQFCVLNDVPSYSRKK